MVCRLLVVATVCTGLAGTKRRGCEVDFGREETLLTAISAVGKLENELLVHGLNDWCPTGGVAESGVCDGLPGGAAELQARGIAGTAGLGVRGDLLFTGGVDTLPLCVAGGVENRGGVFERGGVDAGGVTDARFADAPNTPAILGEGTGGACNSGAELARLCSSNVSIVLDRPAGHNIVAAAAEPTSNPLLVLSC